MRFLCRYFEPPSLEPHPARILRLPDPVFVESLKNEMRKKPTSSVTPITGVVYLHEGEAFNQNHASSCSYETIGGNHTRIALQELRTAYPENQHYKCRMVAVYANLANHLALCLATKHNRATGFIHSMTTQDKV